MSEKNVQDKSKIEQFFELNKLENPDYQKKVKKIINKIDELYVGSIMELGEKDSKSGVMKNGEGKVFSFGHKLTINDQDAIVAYNFVKGFGDGKANSTQLNINPNININNLNERTK